MGKHISDGSEHELTGNRIELSLSGTQFIEDHFGFWLHDGTGDGAGAPDRQLPHLSNVLVLHDLPEPATADPGLRGPDSPYLIQSDPQLPTSDELWRQLEQGREGPSEG